MILLLIAAVILGLLAIAALAWGVYTTRRERDSANLIFGGLMALVFGGLAAMFGWLWVDAHSPTFELKKREWACTASHEETGLVAQKIGDTTVMMPTTDVVCDVYTRR
jgi:heme A synthase